MKLRRIAGLAVAAASLACTTDVVALRYAPKAAAARAAPDRPLVSVGEFRDQRDQDYGPDWLGAVRGPFGSADKELRTAQPTSEVVRAAFADGLRARGLLAEAGPGKLQIEGAIQKLDCSRYMRMEAHVHVEVRVTDPASHALLHSKEYAADLVEPPTGVNGVFADIEPLRALAEKAVSELVDQVLSDPKLESVTRG